LADFSSDLDAYIAKRQEKAAAQPKAPQVKEKPEEPKKEEPKPEDPPKKDENSEEGGFGTLILAGIVLAVTLGAVNILKNK
jgi:ribosomal protein L12E/L44/L45/RPP1/RPP2